jgi:Flp pilus assembly protein TadD
MRSADLMSRKAMLAWTLVAGIATMTGCASVTDPLKSMVASVTSSSPAVTAAAPGSAASAAVKAKAAAPADVAVTPSEQRTFDDAIRALRAGRNEEAERGFRAVAKSNPLIGGPHANLGVMLRQAGKLDESSDELQLAVALSPNQPVYWNQLGVTYRQLGKFDKARTAYEKAIALDDSYAAPYLNLGILCDLYLGDGKRALDLYGQYLALSPGGDPAVTKWVAELKTRKTSSSPQAITVSQKEKT